MMTLLPRLSAQATRLTRLTPTELLIALMVGGVVLAAGLPLYDDHNKRSHRVHAQAALLNTAQWMERAATARGRYPSTGAIPAEVLLVEGGRYVLSVASTDGLSFTLTAEPTADQLPDPCGAYRINQAGSRIQVSTFAVPVPLGSRECWKP